MKLILTLAAAALGFSGVALAAETGRAVLMTDEQMDQIVAGAATINVNGLGNTGGNAVLLGGNNQKGVPGDNVPAPLVGFKGHAAQAAKPCAIC